MCSVKDQGDKAKAEGMEGCLCICVFMMGCPLFPLSASELLVQRRTAQAAAPLFLPLCKAGEMLGINKWLEPLKMSSLFWQIDFDWDRSLTKTQRDSPLFQNVGRPHTLSATYNKGRKEPFEEKTCPRRKPGTNMCSHQRFGTSLSHRMHHMDKTHKRSESSLAKVFAVRVISDQNRNEADVHKSQDAISLVSSSHKLWHLLLTITAAAGWRLWQGFAQPPQLGFVVGLFEADRLPLLPQ